MTPKDRKTCNTLCIISLICLFLPIILGTLFEVLITLIPELTLETATFSAIGNVAAVLTFFALIVGLVLMIIARVRYPHSTFSLVVMIIYIVIISLTIICIIVAAVACGILLVSCGESCSRVYSIK